MVIIVLQYDISEFTMTFIFYHDAQLSKNVIGKIHTDTISLGDMKSRNTRFLDVFLILLGQIHSLVHHLYKELKLSLIITHPGNCTDSVFKRTTTPSTVPRRAFRRTCLLYDDMSLSLTDMLSVKHVH